MSPPGVLSYDADTRAARPETRHADPREDRSSQSTVDAAQRTQSECPFSVATRRRSPRPEGCVATQTRRAARPEAQQRYEYDEARSSQKYRGRRNAPISSALAASPRTPVATSQTESVSRATQRRRAARPGTRQHKDLQRTTSSQKYSGRPTPSSGAFQRRHASTGRHVPDLERLVARPRHDAPPVRGKHGAHSRRSQIITKAQRTPQRTVSNALPASPRICRSRCHIERVVAHASTPPVRKHGNAMT